jgi:hypothetical protein
MRFTPAFCSALLTLVAVAVGASTGDGTLVRPRLGVGYFEPPRSIGTPIDDLARVYSGPGLAGRIAGRILLDTDVSLPPATRELIRRRLALGK